MSQNRSNSIQNEALYDESEISLFDILYLIKGACKTIAIVSILGFFSGRKAQESNRRRLLMLDACIRWHEIWRLQTQALSK